MKLTVKNDRPRQTSRLRNDLVKKTVALSLAQRSLLKIAKNLRVV